MAHFKQEVMLDYSSVVDVFKQSSCHRLNISEPNVFFFRGKCVGTVVQCGVEMSLIAGLS